MADNNSPDYKALFLQAEQRRKQEEERRKQAEDEGRREKERRIQAEDEGKQDKERWEQLQERNRQTTSVEFLRYSHDLLSRPLRVETPSRSTTPSHGEILSDPVGILGRLPSTTVRALQVRLPLPSVGTRGGASFILIFAPKPKSRSLIRH